jgi:hypothetical protein
MPVVFGGRWERDRIGNARHERPDIGRNTHTDDENPTSFLDLAFRAFDLLQIAASQDDFELLADSRRLREFRNPSGRLSGHSPNTWAHAERLHVEVKDCLRLKAFVGILLTATAEE